eukprot:753135-Hanusia_phi.AAC.7
MSRGRITDLLLCSSDVLKEASAFFIIIVVLVLYTHELLLGRENLKLKVIEFVFRRQGATIIDISITSCSFTFPSSINHTTQLSAEHQSINQIKPNASMSPPTLALWSARWLGRSARSAPLPSAGFSRLGQQLSKCQTEASNCGSHPSGGG